MPQLCRRDGMRKHVNTQRVSEVESGLESTMCNALRVLAGYAQLQVYKDLRDRKEVATCVSSQTMSRAGTLL